MAADDLELDEFNSWYLELQEHFNNDADYGELLRAFLGELETHHSSFFAGQHAPSGTAWKPLAPSTIKRKGHATILVDTGRLKSSLTGRSGDSIREVISEGMNHGVSFGTGVPYSIFHQGLEEGEQRGRLPQRVHVGVNDAIMNDLMEKVADRTVDIVLGTTR